MNAAQLAAIKVWGRHYHLNESTVAAKGVPSDSEIDAEVEAWAMVTRLVSAPVPASADVLTVAEDIADNCGGYVNQDGVDYIAKRLQAVILAETNRCVECVEYVRKNISVTNKKRVRFDIYDLNRTFKDACQMVREKITGTGEERWKPDPDAEGGAP